MAIDIVMPRLSDTMEEGRILKWLKREGDTVKKGEAIAEIETDKANMELEAFEPGTIEKIVVGEGESVPVGQVIAYMRTAAAVPAGAPPPAPPPRPAAEAPPPAPPRPEAPPSRPAEEERIKASPLARRIAAERGIDLSRVKGTGPEGRITREDVLSFIQEMEEAEEARRRAAAPPPPEAKPAPPPVAAPAPPEIKPPSREEIEGARTVELTKMQATIAKRMAHSKTTIPHFYVTSGIDMTAARKFLEEANAAIGGEVKIGFNDLVLKASAQALTKFPHVNASYLDGKIEFHDRINVGMAVDLPEGLMVPVIHDCHKKSLREVALEARQIIERVRSGRMSAADFEGGTFTVSNLGMFDVEHFAAIINPPESAILCVGSVHPIPHVVDGQIAIRDRMRVTLSCDHRVYYGATAARFLQELKRLLENPLTFCV